MQASDRAGPRRTPATPRGRCAARGPNASTGHAPANDGIDFGPVRDDAAPADRLQTAVGEVAVTDRGAPDVHLREAVGPVVGVSPGRRTVLLGKCANPESLPGYEDSCHSDAGVASGVATSAF